MAQASDANAGNAASSTVDSRAFLLLLGQVIAVLVAAWIAGLDEKIGYTVLAFFVVLWIIFLMNRTDTVSGWAAKLGFPSGNVQTAVK